MESIKKMLGFTVFATLFFSMFISFMVSLSNDVNALDTTIAYCPQTHQDVFIFDEDERELMQEHRKILIEKNVIASNEELPRYDVIRQTMLTPKTPHFFELSNDIFYPPKHLPV